MSRWRNGAVAWTRGEPRPVGLNIRATGGLAMDDSLFGKEDARGNWAPKKPVSYGPAFDWPPHPRALLKWFFGFPGYFLPWNVLYAVAAILIWMFLTPSLETLKTFSFTWAGLILLRNIGLAILVYGAWHLWLYVWRKQGTAFKYNRQWPKEGFSGLSRSTTRPTIICSTRLSAACRYGRPMKCCCCGPTRTISRR